jgi:uncharacterized protein (TIGR02147 family)
MDSSSSNHDSPASRLRSELERLRARNPRFSQGAFARKIGLSSGRLSELLSERRLFTLELGKKIAQRLEWDDATSSLFFRAIHRTRRSRKALRKELQIARPLRFHHIKDDEFSLIADWYHFAVLSLAETVDFDAKPAWIARRLGITRAQGREAVDRLRRLDLLKMHRGKLVPTHRDLATASGTPSQALRLSHKQSIAQASDALEEVPLRFRDITSITMAVDISKVDAARDLIRDFRRKLSAFMETGARSEVYNLNIQLVPVSRVRKRKSTQERASP